MIGVQPGASSRGLNTWYSSGSTLPWTTFSPSPHAALISTTLSKPVSVSIENITPAPPRSERTMRWTPIDSATLQVVEALGLAVADRAIGEERGEAAPAGVEQRRLAADVEEGLLLAGEARVGQVLGRGAGTHGDGGVAPARAPAERRGRLGGSPRPCRPAIAAPRMVAGNGDRPNVARVTRAAVAPASLDVRLDDRMARSLACNQRRE